MFVLFISAGGDNCRVIGGFGVKCLFCFFLATIILICYQTVVCFDHP